MEFDAYHSLLPFRLHNFIWCSATLPPQCPYFLFQFFSSVQLVPLSSTLLIAFSSCRIMLCSLNTRLNWLRVYQYTCLTPRVLNDLRLIFVLGQSQNSNQSQLIRRPIECGLCRNQSERCRVTALDHFSGGGLSLNPDRDIVHPKVSWGFIQSTMVNSGLASLLSHGYFLPSFFQVIFHLSDWNFSARSLDRVVTQTINTWNLFAKFALYFTFLKKLSFLKILL